MYNLAETVQWTVQHHTASIGLYSRLQLAYPAPLTCPGQTGGGQDTQQKGLQNLRVASVARITARIEPVTPVSILTVTYQWLTGGNRLTICDGSVILWQSSLRKWLFDMFPPSSPRTDTEQVSSDAKPWYKPWNCLRLSAGSQVAKHERETEPFGKVCM